MNRKRVVTGNFITLSICCGKLICRRNKKAKNAMSPPIDAVVQQEEYSQPFKHGRKRSKVSKVVESPTEEVSSSEEETGTR
jgi:hypothetical protein